MAVRDPETEDSADPRIDERVIDALLDHHGRIAFNGLRRALHVHPESLTRALRRLERDGLIRREQDGYSVMENSMEATEGRLERSRSLIASVELAPGLPRAEILGTLAGRWFGSLRWVGIHEHPGDPWLVWSVGNQEGHVMLSVRRGVLRVYVDRDRPDAGRRGLETAAHELLRYALERLTRFPVDSRKSSDSVFLTRLGSAPELFQPN
jgi:DNA-binding transcriptional ArsR family regulator